MRVEGYLNSILPRSESALQAGSGWLKGRESKEIFEKILENETKELVELQQNLGLNYVIDGQLFWSDFLRPVAKALGLHRENSSADENPVTRQIYTNTFYRKPFFSESVENFKGKLIDEKFIQLIEEGKRKVILPSPFALAYLSDGIHRNENGRIKNDVFIDTLFGLAKIFNNEAKRLGKNGNINFIQFNDPCMCYAEETSSLWGEIAESLNIAAKSLNVTTSLHLYNGDSSKFLPKLLDLPVKRIGVDAYTTNLSGFPGKKFKKYLELGLINSKNSLVEEPRTIAKYAGQAIKKIKPEGLALVPNGPLELVPQNIAIKKVESLANSVELLNKDYA